MPRSVCLIVPAVPSSPPVRWAGLRRRRDRLVWAAGGIPRFAHAAYADLPPTDPHARRRAGHALLRAAFGAELRIVDGDQTLRIVDGDQTTPADLTVTFGDAPPPVPGRPTVRLPADPLLFLPPAPSAPPDRPAGGLAIGLQIAFAGPRDDPWLGRRLMLFGAALRALARRRDCAVWCFADSPAERALPDLLRHAGLPVTVIDRPAETALACYAALDLHLAQSPGSAALAANAGTPCLGVDAGEAAGLFDALDLASCLLAETDTNAARLGQRIDDLLRDRDRLARHLADRVAALRAECVAALRAGGEALPRRA